MDGQPVKRVLVKEEGSKDMNRGWEISKAHSGAVVTRIICKMSCRNTPEDTAKDI